MADMRRFIEVGREKRTWDADVEFTWDGMYREVKRRGALMSQDIDFIDPAPGEPGQIFAGMRCVGQWQLLGPLGIVEATS